MKPGLFFWKLFLGNALLMTLILGVSIYVIVGAVQSAYVEQVVTELKNRAEDIENTVTSPGRDIFDKAHSAALDKLAHDLGGMESEQKRVTIIGPDGSVWADSDANATDMENHGERPEIKAAMATGFGESQRYSNTVERELKYVARRVDNADGTPRGVIRVAMPVFSIAEQTGTMQAVIWKIAFLGLLASFVTAMGLAFLWSSPIKRITETARSLSEGDLSARTEVRGHDEIAQMATSLNHMRASLANQLHTIDRQRNNLEYLIQTLTEGVIVADPKGRVALINQAAGRLLTPHRIAHVDDEETGSAPNLQIFTNQHVSDCIPHQEIRNLLLDRLEEGETINLPSNDGDGTRTIRELPVQVVQPDGVVHLLARGSDIFLDSTGPDQNPSGRLVVLTDVTELTRTIRMKTDFVANASHELRTPLSTIRAAVETLDQMDFERDGASAHHFVNVIDRHTQRLEELVCDLLDLSRLEASSADFPVETVNVVDFLDELYLRFEHSMKVRGLLWEQRCPEACNTIRVNGRLLRLVVDNLISNAIKFTESGGHVRVICERDSRSICVTVQDEGCGIDKAEQDRVFERFYQVEPARSEAGTMVGAKRGTGLGLSIVRHAVAAMRADVELESTVGEGTSVTVRIPQLS